MILTSYWAPMRGSDPDISRLTYSLNPRKYRRVIYRSIREQASALSVEPPNRNRLDKNRETYDLEWAPKQLPFGLTISDAELLNTRAGLVALTIRQRASGYTISTATGLSEPSGYRPELWIHIIGKRDKELEEELVVNVFDTFGVRCRNFYPYSQRFDELSQASTPSSRAGLASVPSAALDALTDRTVRQALIKLNQSGGKSVADFKLSPTETGWTTDDLLDASLIQRVSIDDSAVVMLSPMGRDLLSGSTWHSLVIGRVLLEHGMPPSAVMIEQMLAGHEIDVLANVHGRLALIEAKDGRFEIGQAYPVVAKAQMVQPDLVIVVATDGFESAAKATLSPSAIFPRRDFPDLVLGNRKPREPTIHFVSESDPKPELNSILDAEIKNVAAASLQDALDAGTLEAVDLLDRLGHSVGLH